MSLFFAQSSFSRLQKFCWIFALLLALLPTFAFAGYGQSGKQDDNEEAVDRENVPTAPPVVTQEKNKPPTDPQLIQVQLWDGSIITGKVKLKSFRIRTEFGVLDVPIGRVRRLLPGYQSYPRIVKDVNTLVTQLGDKDFDVREAAQRELISRGLLFRDVIAAAGGETNAEQKKRLAEVDKEFNGLMEELEEEGEVMPRSLIRQDTLETDSFAIVGDIELKELLVETKFGDLKVTLADIKSGDRTVFQSASEVSKSVSVKGEAFFQRKPTATRIRVSKGDRISIRGSGTVNWTNWNQTSTVTGLPNQGQYQGMPCGTLAARIGSSGKLIKIGDKKVFTATSSGMLYLGIAMQDNYVNESSYRWTGNYRAKVKVEPKQ